MGSVLKPVIKGVASIFGMGGGAIGAVKNQAIEPKPQMPTWPDDEKALLAKRKAIKSMANRRGRESTINTMSDTLG